MFAGAPLLSLMLRFVDLQSKAKGVVFNTSIPHNDINLFLISYSLSFREENGGTNAMDAAQANASQGVNPGMSRSVSYDHQVGRLSPPESDS